jgi:hypothetical protein
MHNDEVTKQDKNKDVATTTVNMFLFEVVAQCTLKENCQHFRSTNCKFCTHVPPSDILSETLSMYPIVVFVKFVVICDMPGQLW